MSQPLNKFSRVITQDISFGGPQAMLYATGLRDEDFDKPQVGIAATGTRAIRATCTSTDLPAKAKEGVLAAGLVGMRFNTIGVSDGISMGTEGMSYLAAVAGPDRRFDRNRDVRPVVRRPGGDSRLR